MAKKSSLGIQAGKSPEEVTGDVHDHGGTAAMHAGRSSQGAHYSAIDLVQIQLSLPDPVSDTQLPGNVLPILHEIAAMLETFLATGETNCIDLRRSPLSPREFDALREVLGQGEVLAEVNSLGPTRIYETTSPGVWWTTHLNQDEEILGEFIEITACPEMLKAPAEELQTGLNRLRTRLASETREVNLKDVARSLEALGLNHLDTIGHLGVDRSRLESVQ